MGPYVRYFPLAFHFSVNKCSHALETPHQKAEMIFFIRITRIYIQNHVNMVRHNHIRPQFQLRIFPTVSSQAQPLRIFQARSIHIVFPQSPPINTYCGQPESLQNTVPFCNRCFCFAKIYEYATCNQYIISLNRRKDRKSPFGAEGLQSLFQSFAFCRTASLVTL